MMKVAPTSLLTQKAYDEIAGGLAVRGAVASRMFGMPTLKASGKAFAGIFGDAMVFKLTGRAHATASTLAGAKAFDPSGKGRPMKEWVIVPRAHATKWRRLAEDALAFVDGSPAVKATKTPAEKVPAKKTAAKKSAARTSASSAPSIASYNDALTPPRKKIADALARHIQKALPAAEAKVWHGAPVWFLEGNPVVGYTDGASGVRLLFWSGQSFGEPSLSAEGKFTAAQAVYGAARDIDVAALSRWLRKAESIQWDYKNVAKRRGVLEMLKGAPEPARTPTADKRPGRSRVRVKK